MSPTSHEEYRANQRAQWAVGAAAWMRWWAPFERGADTLSTRIVQAARIAPGMRVFDLCTGLGEPALRVARAVGTGGRVVAADLSRAMLDFARRRALDQDLSNVRFVELEGERLAMAARSFDAATFRWGPMLMDNPVACLKELRRVLEPGARLGTSVWGTGKEVPFIALSGLVAEEIAGVERPPPGTPGPLRMGQAGQLEEALAAAGFTDIRCEEVEVVMSFASPREYVDFTRDVSTVLRKKLEDRPAEVRERMWSELEKRTAAFADAQGVVRFRNRTWCAGARA